MSGKIFVLVLAVVIGVSHTLPARNDDVELVNPQNSGARSDFPDSYWPRFGDGLTFGFPDLSGLQDYISRVRESIAATFAGVTQGIDLSKGNTTSEVKIIDGNRVTINRTVINENGVHMVIKNVDVRPVGDSAESDNPTGSTPAVSSTQPRDREDLETFETANNELGKYNNLERFDEVDYQPHNSNTAIETFDALPYDISNDINVNKMAKRQNNEDVEEFDINSVNSFANHYNDRKQSQPLKNMQYVHQNVDHQQRQNEIEDVEEVFHDLSGDTYVNDLLARKMAAAAVAESIGKPRPEAYNAYNYDNVANFRDLSHDTYVNELAARRGMPKNPDAEEFDAEEYNPIVFPINNNALRKRQS